MWVVEIDLGFVRGANTTCFWCEHANWREYCVGGPNWLDFSVGGRTWLDSSLEWNGLGCCADCWKWLNFSLVGRHWFGFCVAVENDLVLAPGSKLTLFTCQGIEIDVIVEWRSKLASFQWWGRISHVFYVRDRNRIGFSVAIELDLFFLRGSKSPSALCAGRRLLGLNLWIEVTLFCSVGIELDFGFVRWPKIA